MNFKVEHLFSKNKFWDNTRNKHNISNQNPILGSILRKRNLVLVNLTGMWLYCKQTRQRLDITYARIIAHELFHLIIMNEVKVEENGEECVVNKTIEIKPIFVSREKNM